MEDILNSKQSERLKGLLEYVTYLGKVNQKPAFRVDDYGYFKVWEHELKGRIGVQHDIVGPDGDSIWLRIERLKRVEPPALPDNLKEWVVISNDPENIPQTKKVLIKTLSGKDVANLISQSVVKPDDISDSLKNENPELKQKDVIFRFEEKAELKSQFDLYLNEYWACWSEKEKPRRETIKIYDSLFSLQQKIESNGDDQPIELILGVGIARWLCDGHEINYPMIEKQVEIEINRDDGALLIRPRGIRPNLETSAFLALEVPGVEPLLRFEKKFFDGMSDDIEFSPFANESFEPLLRQAATHLNEHGRYWPDINPDKENRTPNKASESLEITDSWIIFARPRGATGFVQDLERFKEKISENSSEVFNPVKKLVTELSDKKSLIGENALAVSNCQEGGVVIDKSDDEILFPKEFNEAQVQIVSKLGDNDGVVVQGPPGTGKTHTIANIICHYLATGRTVLVTSKGEPALSVLQEQIPEELRSLTISLLTNERQGMKQLEKAIQLLSSMVSQTKIRDLRKEELVLDKRVKQLRREITKVDDRIKEWGLKQLNPVEKELSGQDKEITAMQLAELVQNDSKKHNWLQDKLGPEKDYEPLFTDSDISKVRKARQKVGKDITYVGKSLPSVQDLPDTAYIVAMHEDFLVANGISDELKASDIPPLSVSVKNAVEKASKLVAPLQQLLEFIDTTGRHDWLRDIYKSSVDGKFDDEKNIFKELQLELYSIVKRRNEFTRNRIDIPANFEDAEQLNDILKKFSVGKKYFSTIFKNKKIKGIVKNIRIDSETPVTKEGWLLVYEYFCFQNDAKKFITRWNHVGDELGLPTLTYQFGAKYKDVHTLSEQLLQLDEVLSSWNEIKEETIKLFPHGITVSALLTSQDEVQKLIHAIELNTSRIRMGSQRSSFEDIISKLSSSSSDISRSIKDFFSEYLGSPDYSSKQIIQMWQDLIHELNRLHEMALTLEIIDDVAKLVEDSGAPLWANKLRSVPFSNDDNLTPEDWYEAWQWKRRYQYIQQIDGREVIRKLSNDRLLLDSDLKKTFLELIKVKTTIGLHSNMTERVQGALMRFVSSIAKIGKGTGKRAPRHRKDAYRAMQDCFGGVPCWIMPTWRISESLPSEFGSFDLVIIDEASQSDITALPAILRAKKILIVGDDKQVSPTAAFFAEEKILQLKHNFLRNQPFAELFVPGVSIYDMANAVFPGQRIMLVEHFRCVEPIIRFSMQFYNEPLVPLRIPKVSEKLTPPLIDIYVENACRDERRKINELEADAIISEIKYLVGDKKYAERSIGVISLIGQQQAKYIQDRLLAELGEDVFENYQITCGDAATFQGKERDIVLLSMVVGPGQGAVMNKRENEQRVNVALSRARDRMYLVRSVEESDLKNETDLKLKVLRHFSNPMPYKNSAASEIDLCESGFERSVYTRLMDLGYRVIPQVKAGAFSIDLVVEGENDRRLAIELDGDKYHPPEKWLDDWKRQRTLERVGWRFWRCWGSSYITDPERCIEELIAILDEMKIFPVVQGESTADLYTEYRIYQDKDRDHTLALSVQD